jgi:hypothetical protein
MFSLEVIKAMNAEAATKARRERPALLRVAAGDQFCWPPVVVVPFVGDAGDDYDRDHERLDTLFVDTSGFGQPGEPALTMGQLGGRLRELTTEHGPVLLATVEQGQFQAHLAVWAEGSGTPARG